MASNKFQQHENLININLKNFHQQKTIDSKITKSNITNYEDVLVNNNNNVPQENYSVISLNTFANKCFQQHCETPKQIFPDCEFANINDINGTNDGKSCISNNLIKVNVLSEEMINKQYKGNKGISEDTSHELNIESILDTIDVDVIVEALKESSEIISTDKNTKDFSVSAFNNTLSVKEKNTRKSIDSERNFETKALKQPKRETNYKLNAKKVNVTKEIIEKKSKLLKENGENKYNNETIKSTEKIKRIIKSKNVKISTTDTFQLTQNSAKNKEIIRKKNNSGTSLMKKKYEPKKVPCLAAIKTKLPSQHILGKEKNINYLTSNYKNNEYSKKLSEPIQQNVKNNREQIVNANSSNIKNKNYTQERQNSKNLISDRTKCASSKNLEHGPIINSKISLRNYIIPKIKKVNSEYEVCKSLIDRREPLQGQLKSDISKKITENKNIAVGKKSQIENKTKETATKNTTEEANTESKKTFIDRSKETYCEFSLIKNEIDNMCSNTLSVNRRNKYLKRKNDETTNNTRDIKQKHKNSDNLAQYKDFQSSKEVQHNKPKISSVSAITSVHNIAISTFESENVPFKHNLNKANVIIDKSKLSVDNSMLQNTNNHTKYSNNEEINKPTNTEFVNKNINLTETSNNKINKDSLNESRIEYSQHRHREKIKSSRKSSTDNSKSNEVKSENHQKFQSIDDSTISHKRMKCVDFFLQENIEVKENEKKEVEKSEIRKSVETTIVKEKNCAINTEVKKIVKKFSPSYPIRENKKEKSENKNSLNNIQKTQHSQSRSIVDEVSIEMKTNQIISVAKTTSTEVSKYSNVLSNISSENRAILLSDNTEIVPKNIHLTKNIENVIEPVKLPHHEKDNKIQQIENQIDSKEIKQIAQSSGKTEADVKENLMQNIDQTKPKDTLKLQDISNCKLNNLENSCSKNEKREDENKCHTNNDNSNEIVGSQFRESKKDNLKIMSEKNSEQTLNINKNTKPDSEHLNVNKPNKECPLEEKFDFCSVDISCTTTNKSEKKFYLKPSDKNMNTNKQKVVETEECNLKDFKTIESLTKVDENKSNSAENSKLVHIELLFIERIEDCTVKNDQCSTGQDSKSLINDPINEAVEKNKHEPKSAIKSDEISKSITAANIIPNEKFNCSEGNESITLEQNGDKTETMDLKTDECSNIDFREMVKGKETEIKKCDALKTKTEMNSKISIELDHKATDEIIPKRNDIIEIADTGEKKENIITKNEQVETVLNEFHNVNFEIKDTCKAGPLASSETKDIHNEQNKFNSRFLQNQPQKDAKMETHKNVTNSPHEKLLTKSQIVNLNNRLGKQYVFGEIIHKGYHSDIIKARNKENSSIVAIKVLHARFSKFQDKHLYILELIQNFNETGEFHCVKIENIFAVKLPKCIVMEYFPKNLAQELKSLGGGFSLQEVQMFSRQLLSAVMCLRVQEILHKAIYPGHILISADRSKIKLTGFDRAIKRTDSTISTSQSPLNYLAPEVLLGCVPSYPADIWAAACTMFIMATGETLFPGREVVQVLNSIITQKGSIPCDVINNGAFSRSYFEVVSNRYVLAPRQLSNFNQTVGQRTARLCKARSENENKLRDFCSLLKGLLNLDYKKRRTIELAYIDPFIYQ